MTADLAVGSRWRLKDRAGDPHVNGHRLEAYATVLHCDTSEVHITWQLAPDYWITPMDKDGYVTAIPPRHPDGGWTYGHLILRCPLDEFNGAMEPYDGGATT